MTDKNDYYILTIDGNKIEAFEIIRAICNENHLYGYEGFLMGNVIKYLVRYRRKDNPKEDLIKAYNYLGKLIFEMKEDM